MKKAIRAAYEKANIDPKADVYMSRALWDVAQERRTKLSETYGFKITEEMAAICTLVEFECRQVAHRMSDPFGHIVVFVPGANNGHRVKDIFRELVSVKRGELTS